MLSAAVLRYQEHDPAGPGAFVGRVHDATPVHLLLQPQDLGFKAPADLTLRFYNIHRTKVKRDAAADLAYRQSRLNRVPGAAQWRWII